MQYKWVTHVKAALQSWGWGEEGRERQGMRRNKNREMQRERDREREKEYHSLIKWNSKASGQLYPSCEKRQNRRNLRSS